MKTNQLLIVNCLVCLCFVLLPTEGSMFSILAYAAIANLLRPKSRYRPQPTPASPLSLSHLHQNQPSPVYYDSVDQSPGSPVGRPLSLQSLLPQSSHPDPSQSSSASFKRGFGYPGSSLTLDSNPVINWAKSLKSHPESQKVPSFYGSYPPNGYQIFNGPPPPSGLLANRKSGVQPVYKLAGIADHFKSVPDKGFFQF